MDKVLLTLKPNIVAQNKEALNKLESIKRQQHNKVSMELKLVDKWILTSLSEVKIVL